MSMREPSTSRPSWATSNQIIFETAATRLRCFRPGGNRPWLILPPQAGHHSCVADFDQGKSLVQTLLRHSADGVYAVEWKPCTWDRRNETIDDLVRQAHEAVERVGDEVRLVGLCQGGWVSAIYAALHPERVAKLILAAAPIDFAAGGGKIQAFVRSTPMAFYQAMVYAGAGLMRGANLLLGFKLLNPVGRFWGDYADLLIHAEDRAHIERWRRFSRWYEYTQDVAGGWYLQAVERLFKRNELVHGRLEVLGKRVDLGRIRCKTVLIAATGDDITLPGQVFNAGEHIGTPRRNILKLLIQRCGHIGVFIKPAALNAHWVEAIRF